MAPFYHQSDITETYHEVRSYFLVTLLFVTSLITWLTLLYGVVPQTDTLLFSAGRLSTEGKFVTAECASPYPRSSLLVPTVLNTAEPVTFASNNSCV